MSDTHQHGPKPLKWIGMTTGMLILLLGLVPIVRLSPGVEAATQLVIRDLRDDHRGARRTH